jgi:hypothetical protein
MVMSLLNDTTRIKINNIEIKRSRFLYSHDHSLFNNSIAGKYLLDNKIHKCNLQLRPMATIKNGFNIVYINMECIKLELLD